MSVILPGWLLYKILPGLAANVGLHLLLFWLAVFSFYKTVLAMFGRPVALVSALALACHPFFLDAIGENYVDGFGLAYFVAALYFVTKASCSGGRDADLLAAGGFATACLSANLFYAVFLPFLVFHFLVLRISGDRRPVLSSALFAVGGAAGAFLAFCAASKILGGRFLYILGSTSFVTSLLSQPSPFKMPYAQWLPEAMWLVLPAIVSASAILFLGRLIRRRLADPGHLLAYSQVQFLLFMVMMAGWQIGKHAPVLQFPFYASLLLPGLFLALAGQLAPAFDQCTSGELNRIVWGTTALLALSVFVAPPSSSFRSPISPDLLLPLATGSILVLVVAVGWRTPLVPMLVILSLSASQALSHRFFRYYSPLDIYGGGRIAFFKQIEKSVSIWRRVDSSGNLLFWYDYNESPGVIYDCITATSLSGLRMISMGFPEIVKGRTAAGRPLAPGLRAVILSQRRTAIAEAQIALKRLDLSERLIAEERIDGPAGAFTMSFIEITR
jgi:hypothetical protein